MRSFIRARQGPARTSFTWMVMRRVSSCRRKWRGRERRRGPCSVLSQVTCGPPLTPDPTRRSGRTLRLRAVGWRHNLHNLRQRPTVRIRDHGLAAIKRYGGFQFKRPGNEVVRFDAQEVSRLSAMPHAALAQDAAKRNLLEQNQLLRVFRKLAEKNFVCAEFDRRFVVIQTQYDLAIIEPAALVAAKEGQVDARLVERLQRGGHVVVMDQQRAIRSEEHTSELQSRL